MWFPMKAIMIGWSLDQEARIEISRKGFPIVPDFSSTIHGATGRTLKAAIADLGGFDEKPNSAGAMRGYIGLSRTTDAEGLIISRLFSPQLFAQGPQPFPSLLMQRLQGEVTEDEVIRKCDIIEQERTMNNKASSKLLLKNMRWDCSKWKRVLAALKYLVHVK